MHYERLSVWFRSNDSRFGGVLVFGFFMLQTIFLILSPWDDLNKETSNIGQFESVGKK